MGNGMERQLSLRKKAANAMERLDVLEGQVDDVQKTIPQLGMAMNQALQQMNQMVAELRETLDAVVGLVGVEAVQSLMKDNRLQKMKDAAIESKAAIAKALEEGKLVATDKISEKSLICGKEFLADGQEIPPGYAALRLVQVKDDYRIKLLGQGKGFSIPTDSGGRFEIMEVYDPVEKAPAPAPEPLVTPEPVTTPDVVTPQPEAVPAVAGA